MSERGSAADVRFIPQEFSPDWVVSPGSLIQREINAGGFSQADVASRANISAKHLNQILKGHVPLTPEVAISLELVLNAPAEIWLRMDVTWQAAKARETVNRSFANRADWVNKFPSDVLLERGLIKRSESTVDKVEKILKFFQVADTSAFDKVWLMPQASYKRSQKFEIDPYATALWLRLAEVQAEAIALESAPYSASKLRKVVHDLPGLSREPIKTAFRKVQRMLLESGVILVFIPEIKGTRICGATRWLSSSHPVVALTGRHRFLDIFWFTMLHELAHVLLHPKRATYLNVEKVRGAVDNADSQESVADDFAESLLLNESDRKEVVKLQTVDQLIEFAERVELSPGIVAGQYGHRTGDWSRFGKVRERRDLTSELAVENFL